MTQARLEWIGSDRLVARQDLLYAGTMLIVGRAIGTTITVEGDLKVSRQHAGLTYADGGWFVQDVGSTLGTFLVRGTQRWRVQGTQALHDGDRIGVGKTLLKFISAASGGDSEERGQYFDTDIVLTRRELEFLQVLCRNRLEGSGGPPGNQELADSLQVALPTVRTHLSRLYSKFDLERLPTMQRKAALVERAVSEGWVS